MRSFALDSAGRIAGLYVLVAGTWFLVSDWLLATLTDDPELLLRTEILRNATLVAVTAALLYFERKRTDRDQRQLAAIVESSDDAIVGKTLDGTITSWNRGAERLYGYTLDEVKGRPITLLAPPDLREELANMLDRIGRGERIQHHETERLRKDGERVTVSVSLSPIVDASGRITGASAIGRDLTDRKRAEEATRMAEVGKLASGLAHEVRNPLNAMRMQVEVIRSRINKPEKPQLDVATKQLEHLESEVLRLQDVVSAFLAYGRPPADEPEELNLAELAREVVEFLKPEFKMRGIEANVEVESSAETSNVIIDRRKLRQVLLNLAQNAADSMHDGGAMTVRIVNEPLVRDVCFSVCDTGCGIPEEELPRVFDAFYSTKPAGNGMGLAIVKRIVDAAGGNVGVDSQPGKGTSFSVCLPVASAARRKTLRPRGHEQAAAINP
jgi:PAS domain S-box-containing protein